MDTLFLFLSLLLFSLLRLWGNTSESLITLLFTCNCLPLTYQFAYFHPWDRASLFLWILLLYLVARNAPVAILAVLFVVAVLVKHDVILVPIVFLLSRIGRKDLIRPLWQAGLLAALAYGTLAALRYYVGGETGSAPTAFASTASQVKHNLEVMVSYHVMYPPLLVFLLPSILAILGWRKADQFSRAAAVVAVLMLITIALRANVVEVRALMPALVMLLPASMQGLRDVLQQCTPNIESSAT